MDATIVLAPCGCGGTAEFRYDESEPEQSVYVMCNICGLQTPKKKASLEYSAKHTQAGIWNTGVSKVTG